MRLLAFRKRLMNYREMREELGMKRSMRFAAVMIAAVMTVGTASTAMAAEWKHDSKGWWWQNDDGSYPADKTLTDTRTVGGSTYVDNYRYYGAGWNGYTCFELVSADEKASIFFSAPVVMETGYSTIHRQ